MRSRHVRTALKIYWRVFNPLMKPICGRLRWWVLLETVGRRSGIARVTPLAAGPREGDVMWLIAVHGDRADFVRNIRANPAVRVRHRGVWHSGTATVHDFDSDRVATFNAYARMGPRVMGMQPRLVRVALG